MKETYVEPKMEVIEFETEDIIRTSGGGIVNPDAGIILPDDNW